MTDIESTIPDAAPLTDEEIADLRRLTYDDYPLPKLLQLRLVATLLAKHRSRGGER